MKVEISKEWCARMAKLEDGCDVGAGGIRPMVKVKELEWEETREGGCHNYRGGELTGWEAMTPLEGLYYQVELLLEGPFRATASLEQVGRFNSPEEAKAACQADFERRVLSCLETEGGE